MIEIVICASVVIALLTLLVYEWPRYQEWLKEPARLRAEKEARMAREAAEEAIKDAKFEATVNLLTSLNRNIEDFSNCAPLEDCYADLQVIKARYESALEKAADSAGEKHG